MVKMLFHDVIFICIIHHFSAISQVSTLITNLSFRRHDDDATQSKVSSQHINIFI